MPAPAIRPYRPIVPMIYAYTTPGVANNDGWIKIGYTEKYGTTAKCRKRS